MSDIEWSPWIENTKQLCPTSGSVHIQFRHGMRIVSDSGIKCIWNTSGASDDITHYRIPMEDYKRITGMPDWSEAPEWVEFIAQWSDGEWIGYEREPEEGDEGYEVDGVLRVFRSGKFGTALVDWRDTLQKRPSDQLESHPNSELDADQYTVGGDTVNMPSHYTSGEIECIDAIQAQMTPEQFAGYLRGNCVKYIWRYQHKGGKESLLKAQWYLNKLIEEIE